ncbi:hypothetical protein FOFC_14137 [Fusarium oxysporum]|nr:hypothetical protein FOFC_14137 [Fusarium oxysporum]
MLGTKRKVVSQQGEAPQTPKRRSNRNRANDPNEDIFRLPDPSSELDSHQILMANSTMRRLPLLEPQTIGKAHKKYGYKQPGRYVEDALSGYDSPKRMEIIKKFRDMADYINGGETRSRQKETRPQLYVERAEIDLVGLEACRRIIAAKYSEEYQAMVAKIMEEKAEPEAQEGLEDDGDGDAEK